MVYRYSYPVANNPINISIHGLTKSNLKPKTMVKYCKAWATHLSRKIQFTNILIQEINRITKENRCSPSVVHSLALQCLLRAEIYN